MKVNSAFWIGLTAIVMMAVPLFAHHFFSMFDMTKNVTYKGTVVEYKWVNPHVHVTLQVDPGAGVDPSTTGTWDIEGASTNIMGRQGWTKATFKAADRVTVIERMYQDIARPKAEE